MPQRNKGANCECCCGFKGPPGNCIEDIVEVLSPPALNHQWTVPLTTWNGTPASTLFDYESFGFGATVDSFSVTDFTERVDFVGTTDCALVDMTFTSGTQFSCGVYFFPKVDIQIDPSSEYEAHRLEGLSALANVRHGLEPGLSPTQYYRLITGAGGFTPNPVDTDHDPDLTRAVPFWGTVWDQDGDRFWGVSVFKQFNRCWHLTTQAAPLILNGDGSLGDTGLDLHCYPEPDPPTITKVGYVFGYSTWWDLTGSGLGRTWDKGDTPISTGTYRETMAVSGICHNVGYTERCLCAFRNELNLDVTISGTNSPAELNGITIPITRVSGGLLYTGSLDVDLSPNALNETFRLDGDFIDPSVPISFGFTPFGGGQLGPVTVNQTDTIGELVALLEGLVGSTVTATGADSLDLGSIDFEFTGGIGGQFFTLFTTSVGIDPRAIVLLQHGLSAGITTVGITYDPCVSLEMSVTGPEVTCEMLFRYLSSCDIPVPSAGLFTGCRNPTTAIGPESLSPISFAYAGASESRIRQGVDINWEVPATTCSGPESDANVRNLRTSGFNFPIYGSLEVQYFGMDVDITVTP